MDSGSIDAHVEEIRAHDDIAGHEDLRSRKRRIGGGGLVKDLAVLQCFNPRTTLPIKNVAVFQAVRGQHLGLGIGHGW
jgi:hypothetical protein